MAVPKPDYLSRDYEGLRTSLLSYAAQSFPEWQPASEGDFGMVLVELFSYMGDILSYYTDRAQMENYLGTATQRESVLGLAYLLGYVPTSGTPARGTVTLVTNGNAPNDIVVPAGTQVTTARIAALDGPVKFEVDKTSVVPKAGGSVVVTVTEGTTVNDAKIGESSGLPSQTFLLPNTGVYADTVRVYVEDSTGSNNVLIGTTKIPVREWIRQEHLLDANDNDAVYESVLSGTSTLVTFGDDVNGAIPATGLQVFATYRYGYGSQGNVVAGQITMVNASNLAGVTIQKDSTGAFISSNMVGGADPESTESIRHNAPRAYRTQNRAVTLQDYADIALGVEGVSKANAIVGTFTSVTLYIAGSDGGAPSDTLKELVADRYIDRTLAGVTVTVAGPTFVPVNFGTVDAGMHIELQPQYSQSTAKAAIETSIRAFIGTMPFGQKLTVGMIYDLISQVEGVQYADINVMAREDGDQVGVVTINPRPWELFTVGNIYTTITGGTA